MPCGSGNNSSPDGVKVSWSPLVSRPRHRPAWECLAGRDTTPTKGEFKEPVGSVKGVVGVEIGWEEEEEEEEKDETCPLLSIPTHLPLSLPPPSLMIHREG